MSTAPVAPAFASVSEAMDMARAALGYLAAADATQLAAETQAECLRGLERTDAVATAARASFLSAFTVGKGYSADADYSARAWLMHRTGITRGAAASHTAWARRAGTHPAVLAALAAGDLSESYARAICQWTDKLPEKYREESDELLMKAAAAGLGLADLSALFAEMYERARSDLPDEDPAREFGDRGVRLETTFQGAGVRNGDLTPECAAVVGKALDRAVRSGRGRRRPDTGAALPRRARRSYAPPRRQRHAPRAGWAAGQSLGAHLPHRPAPPRRQLRPAGGMDRPGPARWAGHRAAASEGGGESGAWLDGDAAKAIACDAAMAPIVTGDINIDALDDLVRLCVELDARRDGARDAAWAALEQAVIGKAVDLLSGPGGLASFLRRRQLGVRLSGPSLPLDIGYSENIPAGIRNAVVLRDKHCQWAGRCDQPAGACQVHHTKHKANGGPTSVKDCVLLCWFHHQIVIHRWGWTLVLNPDGTTTAWNKDKTKVLHSHGPPGPAGVTPPGLGVRRLTLTPCEAVDRTCHVQHRGIRTTRPRLGQDAPALRRDRADPACLRRRGHRVPLLPGEPAGRPEPRHRAQGPRIHPAAGAGDPRGEAERGGTARDAPAAPGGDPGHDRRRDDPARPAASPDGLPGPVRLAGPEVAGAGSSRGAADRL